MRERRRGRLRIQQPHHHLLAVLRGQRRYPYVQLPPAKRHHEPPVLRRPPLGDIHVGKDLDARSQGILQRSRHALQVPQHPVHPQPHHRFIFLRLDVYVAGFPLHRRLNHLRDHPHRRRALAQQLRLHFLERILGGLPGTHREKLDFPLFVPRPLLRCSSALSLQFHRVPRPVIFRDAAHNLFAETEPYLDVGTRRKTQIIQQRQVLRVGHDHRQPLVF